MWRSKSTQDLSMPIEYRNVKKQAVVVLITGCLTRFLAYRVVFTFVIYMPVCTFDVWLMSVLKLFNIATIIVLIAATTMP